MLSHFEDIDHQKKEVIHLQTELKMRHSEILKVMRSPKKRSSSLLITGIGEIEYFVGSCCAASIKGVLFQAPELFFLHRWRQILVECVAQLEN